MVKFPSVWQEAPHKISGPEKNSVVDLKHGVSAVEKGHYRLTGNAEGRLKLCNL